MEKMISNVLSSVAVSQVAKAMVGDAEAFHARRETEAGQFKGVRVYEMKEIQKYGS